MQQPLSSMLIDEYISVRFHNRIRHTRTHKALRRTRGYDTMISRQINFEEHAMKLNDIAQRRPAHPPINPLTGFPNAPEAVSGTAAPGSAGAAASDSPKATVPPAAAPNLHNKERDPAYMGTDGERSFSSGQEPASVPPVSAWGSAPGDAPAWASASASVAHDLMHTRFFPSAMMACAWA